MDRQNFAAILQALRDRQPFRPFAIELRGGGRIQVDDGNSMVSRDGTTIFLSADGRLVIFDSQAVVLIIGSPAGPSGQAEPIAAPDTPTIVGDRKPDQETFDSVVPDLMHRRPFQPFVIVLNTGERIEVNEPHSLAFRERGPIVYGSKQSLYDTFRRENVVQIIRNPTPE